MLKLVLFGVALLALAAALLSRQGRWAGYACKDVWC